MKADLDTIRLTHVEHATTIKKYTCRFRDPRGAQWVHGLVRRDAADGTDPARVHHHLRPFLTATVVFRRDVQRLGKGADTTQAARLRKRAARSLPRPDREAHFDDTMRSQDNDSGTRVLIVYECRSHAESLAASLDEPCTVATPIRHADARALARTLRMPLVVVMVAGCDLHSANHGRSETRSEDAIWHEISFERADQDPPLKLVMDSSRV